MGLAERKIQQCLTNLYVRCNKNGFKFFPTKTQCVHFCRRRGIHPDPELFLNNSLIPVVGEARFLGLIFDKKLNFKSHISEVKTISLKALNLLRVLSNTNWGADRKVLLRLYRSLVRSKLDYGSIVYGSTCKSYIGMLDTVHRVFVFV